MIAPLCVRARARDGSLYKTKEWTIFTVWTVPVINQIPKRNPLHTCLPFLFSCSNYGKSLKFRELKLKQ